MTEAIPLTDVAWQHKQVWDELQAAFRLLLEDPTCDGAFFSHQLEQAFEAYFGPPWSAVSAQSGLAAQTLLLRAWGIGPDDEVITVPNSDLATTAAISHTGARFVLADIAPGTFHLDPAAAARAITPRTRALLPVHMYGHPAPMAELQQLADDHKLLLFEDAALALGGSVGDTKLGTFGAGSFFSFAPRKVLGGVGNGGMILVRDPAVAEQVRLLRGYGLEPAVQDLPIAQRHLRSGQLHQAEGFNLKLDGIQAAIVSAKFKHLDAWGALRRAVASRYDLRLANLPGLERPRTATNVTPAWRNYTVLVERRERLRSHLHKRGITTGALYTPPVHLQPVYAQLGLGAGAFPIAEAQAGHLLSLPIYPGMREDQVDRVADEVRTFLVTA